MKVILIESVVNLGLPGDIVDVRNGYARNYLLPKRKAMIATENNVVELEHKKRIAKARRAKVMDDLKIRCETISGTELVFLERVTEAGKLYGSVTSRRIADRLLEQFPDVQANWVQLSDAIKEPGEFEVALKLAPGIQGKIVVKVEAEQVAEATEAVATESAEGEAAEETEGDAEASEPADEA